MRTFIHEPELSGGEINSLDIYAKPKKKQNKQKKHCKPSLSELDWLIFT